MKKTVAFLLIVAITLFAENNKRTKIGIALAGGGALGFAHIGALEVIDSLGIPIDFVAGTSMGGLVGGFVAMGYSPKEIENVVLNQINWESLFNDSPSREELPFIEKETRAKEQLVLKLANNYIPQLPEGLIYGQSILTTLLKFTTPFETVKNFNDLPIPLKVVAVDLVSGKEVVLDKGSLAYAMRSTMSIPTVFSPTDYTNKLLIDGGVVNNFPVDVVKKMGADVVIGLNLTSPSKGKDELHDLMSILNRTMDIPRFNILNKNIRLSDIYIPQNVDGFTPGDFVPEKITQLIARGKKAVYDHLDFFIRLKKKLDNERSKQIISSVNVEGAELFTKTQVAKMLGLEIGEAFDNSKVQNRIAKFTANPFIKKIEAKPIIKGDSVSVDVKIVENPNPVVLDYDIYMTGRQKRIDENLFVGVFKSLKNKPLNLNKLFDKIQYLYSFGYFKTIRFEIFPEGENDIRLLFDISTDYMKEIYFGYNYNDAYHLVGLLGLKVNSSLIPGLRWDVLGAFSGLQAFKSKVSFPSRTLDDIVYPFWNFKYLKRSQNLYGSKASAALGSYYYKTLSNKIGIGFTPTRFSNLEVGYNVEWINLHPSTGFGGYEDVNYHLYDVFAVLTIDALDDFNLPHNGLYVLGELYYSNKKMGAHYDYLRFSIQAELYKTFGIHGFGIMGEYFESLGDEPFPRISQIFGGPSNFIGWEYGAGFFSKLHFIRLEYHLNFWDAFYLDLYGNTLFNYELSFFNPEIEKPSKIFFGTGVGLTYDSIVGPIRIIWSWGDDSVIEPKEFVNREFFTMGVRINDFIRF